MSVVDRNRRQELYDINNRAWNGEQVLDLSTKLDSSLKKNTALIRRLKTSLNPELLPGLIADIKSLTLNKYLSELNQVLYDAEVKITKTDELMANNEIVSLLHQRFSNIFTPALIINVLVGLSNDYNIDNDSIKLARQKNLLRVLMELTLVGVARTIKDVDKLMVPDKILKKFIHKDNISDLIIIVVLKDLLQFEIENGHYIPLAVSFVKRYYPLIKTLLPDHSAKFTTIFKIYTRHSLKILESLHQILNKTIKLYNKTTLKYGKTFEDKASELDELQRKYYYFHANLKNLCQLLEVEFPELVVAVKEDDHFNTHKTISIVNINNNMDGSDSLSVWDSPEEERFYTIIPSLSELASERNEEEFYNLFGNKTDGEKITLFLQHFEFIKSENDVEKLSLIFNRMELNNKATTNRLFKYFTESPYGISYRFYTKFLKINQDSLLGLVDEIIEFLDLKLRSQLHFDRLSFKYIYFYIEFIKFKLIPTFKIFHKLRALTVDLTNSNNMDILTVFYEKCGRFLLFDVDYRDQMLNIISLLKEQQKSADLTVSNKLSIKNLLLTLELPIQKSSKPTNLSTPKLKVKQEFLVRLIKKELNDTTFKHVLRLLKLYDFSDPDYNTLIIDVFTNANMIHYDNIERLIRLLKHLTKPAKNQDILIRVIDQLIENIIRNIEINDYRANRERVLHAKLVSEMQHQNIISFSLVIDLSYKILTTGHPNNQPLPLNYEAELDMPNNYFKIQLICILFSKVSNSSLGILKTKSAFRAPGIAQGVEFKIYSFIIFFQYYTFCKEMPLPKEIEFQLDSMFEQLSQSISFEVYESLQDVLKELQVILECKQQRSNSYKEGVSSTSNKLELGEADDEGNEEDELLGLGDDENELGLSDSDESSDEGDMEEVDYERKDEEDVEEEMQEESLEEEENDSETEEQSSVVETDYSERPTNNDNTETEVDEHPKSLEDRRFEEDLEKQFNKMIVESFSANTTTPAKTANTSITIPHSKSESPKFNLLLRKGKKHDFREIAFADESISRKISKEREQRELHKRKIMSLVLNMDPD